MGIFLLTIFAVALANNAKSSRQKQDKQTEKQPFYHSSARRTKQAYKKAMKHSFYPKKHRKTLFSSFLLNYHAFLCILVCS
jgi:hypothetical protein